MGYRAIPTIHETVEELKERLRTERHPRKKQRLHLLSLVDPQEARNRRHAVALLGVNRDTVGDWLHQYEHEGLDGFLDLYVPRGAESRLTSEALESLEQALHDPRGFATYEDIRVWLVEQHSITYAPGSVGNLCRRKFGTRAKVVRPRPKKNA